MVLNTRKYRKAMEAYRSWHGLAKEKGFVILASFRLGKPGRRLLKRIQENMVATKKYPNVTVTGVLDKATREALIPVSTFGHDVVAKAMGQLNVHESPWGTNTGKDVRKYQSVTHAYYAPWCASFVSWCLINCGYKGRVSARAWDWADFGQPISFEHAIPGDIVTFNIGQGHVGIFLRREGQSVVTVDGNTNNEVAVRVRSRYMIRSITRQQRG